MTAIDVFIDTWVQPAGRVDRDRVLAAVQRELAALLAGSEFEASAASVIEFARLRLDGAAVAAQRVGDADALGVAIARVIAGSFSRSYQ